ncbi:hypothetical protein BDY21DRAFT_386670 [Lineolata rhizophorae]|uniref:Uncharacterized protein n=1 Tax=Lineolata rhizophorae TaxID=578093 RepID=A0A6A6NWW8_9PEZI|nr:hypothetical protein BDY21DRAFT_386670 [Lineolata rhizophorae]
MSSWLAKQKKVDLTQMADQAGLPDHDGMLKDDLVAALDKHLRANASSLSANPAFSDFYSRGSPIKKERPSASSTAEKGSDTESKPRQRRRTIKAKEELESPTENTPDKAALATRTPRAVQRVASRVPLPPSPAVVTDAIDRQTAIFRTRLDKAVAQSGAAEAVEYVREALSSVVGIEACALLAEAWGLQRETLPWRYAFDLPAVPLLGTRALPVRVPDFFLLVTSFFWAPSSLWAATSLLVPLLAAYFFNLSLKARPAAAAAAGGKAATATSASASAAAESKLDPLAFNVAKALVTYLVYAKGVRFGGLVSDETVGRVDGAVPGGYAGVLIGAGIGALGSLYAAVLKK